MEKKIRIVRKAFVYLGCIIPLIAFALVGEYAIAIGGGIGYAIGLGLRKKPQEPDERELLQELFSYYIAGFVVMCFLVVMMARHLDLSMLENPYFQVMIVWLLAWGSSVFVIKKVWK